jgi:aerobic C4-dicarboxylate transport protein
VIPQRRPLYTKLYFQVLVAIVLGVLLGHFYPQLAVQMKPFGDAFVKLIKMVIAPLIFATVVVGIAKMGDLKELGRVGIKAIIYFEIVTTLALVVGLVVVNIIKPGAGINADPKSLDVGSISAYVTTAQKSNSSFVDFLMGIIPSSVVDAFAKGDLLPVLLFSVLFGLALCYIGRWTTTLIDVIDQTAHALFGVVGIIMKLAPIGAFGAMAFTIGKYGLGTLAQLGWMIVAVYTTCIVFVVVVLGAILRIAGFKVWQFLRYFKDEILIVFGATSAEAMIPRLIVKLENMGISRPIVGLVVPAGFSFNMDGTAIYMTMGVMFIAQATNIDLTWSQQLGILLIMLFTSKGAAGVTGGGFIALAATMPAIDVLPIGGLALLVGIDRFMAEIRAASNLVGNAVATAVIGAWEGEVNWSMAKRALEGGVVADEPEKVHEVDTVSAAAA